MGSRLGTAQDFDKYHNHAELTAMLKNMVNSHQTSPGCSPSEKPGGRDIWLVEIANPAGVPVKDRPGLFIAANFEGDHLIGSEAALFIADYLLKIIPATPRSSSGSTIMSSTLFPVSIRMPPS